MTLGPWQIYALQQLSIAERDIANAEGEYLTCPPDDLQREHDLWVAANTDPVDLVIDLAEGHRERQALRRAVESLRERGLIEGSHLSDAGISVLARLNA